MGTKVLIPKDCLGERIRDLPCRRPNFGSSRTYRKKREPSISKRSISVDDVPKISRNHHRSASASALSASSSNRLVMEKVTVLRRGESFESKIGRVGSEKKETGTDPRSPVAGKVEVYAGSAFAVSPSPSSLPLPSFSKKKQISVDDSASRDLRRLLRLDF